MDEFEENPSSVGRNDEAHRNHNISREKMKYECESDVNDESHQENAEIVKQVENIGLGDLAKNILLNQQQYNQ
jgi:hypothetical protein